MDLQSLVLTVGYYLRRMFVKDKTIKRFEGGLGTLHTSFTQLDTQGSRETRVGTFGEVYVSPRVTSQTEEAVISKGSRRGS